MRSKLFRMGLVSVILSGIALGICWADTAGPAIGDSWPEIRLEVPADSTHRTYLGLGDSGTFTVDQIKAELVIVQIFSMYCPHCQREAPGVNAFYQRLQADPKISKRIKLIGIGAGNSRFEVDFFRKTYKIPFPLFPDGKFAIHKQLGQVRTPYFYGITSTGSQTKVIHTHLGGVEEMYPFIDTYIAPGGEAKRKKE